MHTAPDVKNAAALHKQAQASRMAGNKEEALACLEAAININPHYGPAYIEAAEIFTESAEILSALDCYASAVNARPDNISYKDKFISFVQNFGLRSINPQIKQIILDCLDTPGVDVFYAGGLWNNILKIDEEFCVLKKLIEQKAFSSFCTLMEKLTYTEVFAAPLFLSGLRRIRVPDIEFENFLTHLRRYLLVNFEKNEAKLSDEIILKLAESLSHYCFSTDYIFDVSNEEEQKLRILRSRMESQKNPNEKDQVTVAILACYQPLRDLENSESILKNLSTGPLSNLLKFQIQDAIRQEKIRQSIPALTEINDAVSSKVRKQYEKLPYPRWETFSKEIYDETTEGRLRAKNAKILNAGCGTGHEAFELAAVFPDAEILAVDLSLSSLSYAIKKAQDHGVCNITFKQADINEIKNLDSHFEFIASSGVLHHMQDPLKGWRILECSLKPGGLMRIALYSRIGRQAIVEARAIIEEQKYTADPEGVRRFRKDCKKLLKPDSYKKITQSREYYGLSECMDLLFHMQEHQHTLPEIQAWLKELNLKFLGFQIPKSIRNKYIQMFPDDPSGRNLSNWTKFENKHPDTFIGMYRFWCEKA